MDSIAKAVVLYAGSQWDQQFHEKCEDSPIQMSISPINQREINPHAKALFQWDVNMSNEDILIHCPIVRATGFWGTTLRMAKITDSVSNTLSVITDYCVA